MHIKSDKRKELVRRFSKRAIQYMLSYQALDLQSNDDISSVRCSNDSISYQQIEKMKALLNCHRTAIDFDNKFIMTEVLYFNTTAPKKDLYDTGFKSQKKQKNKELENQEIPINYYHTLVPLNSS